MLKKLLLVFAATFLLGACASEPPPPPPPPPPPMAQAPTFMVFFDWDSSRLSLGFPERDHPGGHGLPVER